jgi:hypothetical protein
MVALKSCSNNSKIERLFAPTAGRPPPMTRAEKHLEPSPPILDPTSDSGEVRRSKGGLLVALATPDKLFQVDLCAPEPRTHQEARHSITQAVGNVSTETVQSIILIYQNDRNAVLVNQRLQPYIER